MVWWKHVVVAMAILPFGVHCGGSDGSDTATPDVGQLIALDAVNADGSVDTAWVVTDVANVDVQGEVDAAQATDLGEIPVDTVADMAVPDVSTTPDVPDEFDLEEQQDAPDLATPADVGIDTVTDTTEPDDPDEKWVEEMYSPMTVSEVELFLRPENIQKLFVDPYTYVDGKIRITIGNQVFPTMDVGIRIKGKIGSFRQLNDKSAFRIKFNHIDKKQRFLGLKNATLNNMVQDSSMLHEAVYYKIARAFGLAAPRTGYAWVRLNHRDYGLYLNLETPDDVFLSNHYVTTKHLFEGAYGTDVNPWSIADLEVDEGDETDLGDLQALAAAADIEPGPEWFDAMQKVADLKQMTRAWAMELFAGHWDGYAPTINNYFLHSDDAGMFTMLPWGTDQTFGSWLPWYQGNGKMFARCLQVEACKSLYDHALAELGVQVTELNLDPFVEELAAYLRPWAEKDPRKPYGIDNVDDSVMGTRDFLNNRTADVNETFGCLLSNDPDPDNDGYDCASDCDNNNADIHPGVVDVCGDGLDQDCSGVADDDPGCPDWIEVYIGGIRYLITSTPRTYPEAFAHCEAAGSKPLILNDAQEANALRAKAPALQSNHFWLGLTDTVAEGVFQWWDGTMPQYVAWNGGEPNDWGGKEDCTEWLTSNLWNDLNCEDKRPIVCEDPCPPGPPVDADGDGYVACLEDCDDGNKTIHPGVEDLCWDGVDQDCNGVKDDGPTCPVGCTTLVTTGLKAAVCVAGLSWQGARSACKKMGAELLWVNDAADSAKITTQIQSTGVAGEYWIGLNDIGNEGNYVWADSAPATWFNWADGQPNNSGEQDCTRILPDGKWNDTPCDFQFGYVCRFSTQMMPLAANCIPHCETKQCGDDGCGGSCGECGEGETCTNGACLALAASCDGLCGGQAPAGCFCDAVCKEYGDCCADVDTFCDFAAPEPAAAPAPDSCEEHCGGQAPAGCWCDSLCTGFGDCCGDYSNFCLGATTSCEGGCGKLAITGCYCDVLCETYHDCCEGYFKNCAGGCSCDGLECGDDGCGESCGECGDSEVCDSSGQCVPKQIGWGCSALDPAGCGGCPCEKCVCQTDPFCCYVSWDGICAATCAGDCNDSGTCASP